MAVKDSEQWLRSGGRSPLFYASRLVDGRSAVDVWGGVLSESGQADPALGPTYLLPGRAYQFCLSSLGLTTICLLFACLSDGEDSPVEITLDEASLTVYGFPTWAYEEWTDLAERLGILNREYRSLSVRYPSIQAMRTLSWPCSFGPFEHSMKIGNTQGRALRVLGLGSDSLDATFVSETLSEIEIVHSLEVFGRRCGFEVRRASAYERLWLLDAEAARKLIGRTE